MNADDVDKTITLFNQAVLVPELWAKALEQLAHTFGATGAIAQMIGPAGYHVMPSTAFAATVDSFLAEGWQNRNARMERGLALTRKGVRGFITEYHMSDRDELRRDAYQNEFANRHGVDHEAGIVLTRHESGAVFVLTTPRGQRSGAYWADDLENMNRVSTALAGSAHMALGLKMAHARNLADAITSDGQAAALLSQNGSLLWYSPGLTRHFGRGLRLVAKRLEAEQKASNDALQAAIGAATNGVVADVQQRPIVIRRRTDRPLLARLLPIAGAARDFLGLARAILLIDDLAQSRVMTPTVLIAEVFGLSPAEARLTADLATGLSLREVAQKHQIGYETARTRLKLVFAKTATSRQLELVLLVNRLAGR